VNVSLTKTLEARVKQQVASGMYNNASEVIRDALRVFFERESENEWLKREAAIGYLQLEADQGLHLQSADELDAITRSSDAD